MKQELIFLGPPACGKGTQTDKLSKYLGFPHVDTGSLLRAEIAKEMAKNVMEIIKICFVKYRTFYPKNQRKI